MKNDRALADMLAELDAELAAEHDAWPAAKQILKHVEDRSPGAVQRAAAEQQLRSLGCGASRYVLCVTAEFERPRRAREDIAPPVGRRMVVRCERTGYGHAALIDPRPLFGPTGWPREGRSNRFRCICGCRDCQVTYTANTSLQDGAIGRAAVALWV